MPVKTLDSIDEDEQVVVPLKPLNRYFMDLSVANTEGELNIELGPAHYLRPFSRDEEAMVTIRYIVPFRGPALFVLAPK